ncbi:MAG: S8 family serine peptidase [Phycisphaera sp.]|nr:S8 family serine peptidase [Phycisphaera sp.]
MQPRFVLAAALSATVLSVLGVGLERTASAMQPLRSGGDGPVVGGSGQSGPSATLPRLRVRKPAREEFVLPYDPVSGEAWYTGNIVLKFEDSVMARAPRTSAPGVANLGGGDLFAFQQLLAENKLTVRQWINRTPEQLAALEQRARANSGRVQPDLAGMMIIENVNPKILAELAWEINQLPEIEFANIERIPILHQCGPEAPWPCNAPSPDCDPEGFNCNPDPGDQDADPENTLFGCQDANCCQMIATIIPACNDEEAPNGWDVICAAYANLLCNGTIYDNVNPALPPAERYDPCFTDPTDINVVNPIFADVAGGLQEGCFEPHAGRGCSRPACCFTVCNIDPFCCNAEWDQNCVNLARSDSLVNVCFSAPDPGPTPDYTPFAGPDGVGGHQLYLQSGIADPAGDFPGNPAWTGRGLDLPGFEAIHAQIASTFLNGAAPVARGAGVRVAIIEFSAFVNHEEFVLGDGATVLPEPKVIPEEGQSIILTEGSNNGPQHGTATLGQVVAGDNGFGVRGIANEAQGYFFPIVSFEEGSRAQNAIVSALEIFEPGDVINHSWGSPPDRPLPAIPQYYTLIALGTDLGVTSVVSAGNSNCPIQPQAGEADSGVFIVGAGSPGRRALETGCPGVQASLGRFMRLPFSNYSDPEEELATVHVFAWGQAVTTVGYGDLFVGANGLPPGVTDPENINRLRMYTDEFSGTSSAAPIIAGAVANVQAYAKQMYGAALPPLTLRGIFTSNGEEQAPLAISLEDCGQSTADCCVDGDPDCDGVFKPIGVFPNMRDIAIGVFTGTGWDGNRANIEVHTGIQPRGAPWVSFVIRGVDGSALRIITERRSAGVIVEGMTYLGSGFTTDVEARLTAPTPDPENQVSDIGITTVSRATRNFVMMGAFVRNFALNRYEFIGAQVMTTAYNQFNFDVPDYGAMSDYLDPATEEVELRVWTCGLGQTRSHEVLHDLIEVRINNPFNPL